MMATKKPPYSVEFRRQAVALVRRNPDKSVPELAQELGCRTNRYGIGSNKARFIVGCVLTG